MICKGCRKDVDFILTTCPHCGRDLKKKKSNTSLMKPTYIVVGIRTIMLILALVYGAAFAGVRELSFIIISVWFSLFVVVLEWITIYMAEDSAGWGVFLIILGVFTLSFNPVDLIALIYIFYGAECIKSN